MPTYDYKCSECGHLFEELQSMNAVPLVDCPDCGKPALKRLIAGGAGMVFKGSGFYLTDYGKAGSAKASPSSSSGKPSEKSEKSEKAETSEKSETSGKSEKSEKKASSPKPSASSSGSDSTGSK
jgi:putative FmdB family regulatory protein